MADEIERSWIENKESEKEGGYPQSYRVLFGKLVESQPSFWRLKVHNLDESYIIEATYHACQDSHNS